MPRGLVAPALGLRVDRRGVPSQQAQAPGALDAPAVPTRRGRVAAARVADRTSHFFGGVRRLPHRQRESPHRAQNRDCTILRCYAPRKSALCRQAAR